jgi:aminoglycoside/choline kinase family phosphotransferase
VSLWRDKTHSELYRLEPTYTRAVPSPASFILKLARPDAVSSVANRRRWKEHEFYTRVAPQMSAPPVPFPFAAAYDPDSRRSHLLLEDLTATHLSTRAPLPPTPDQLRGAIDCLAHIHACWWNHPEHEPVVAERDAAWIAAGATSTQRRLERFFAECGSQLPESTRSALMDATAAWPAILRRAATPPLTIVHGDAHPWNFLTPLAPDTGRVCLLDWEGWSIEPGPHDLASLIALHLPVVERRALEQELVARYAGRLQEHGVLSYEPAACWDDYRRAVARRVLSPVGLWSRGSRARSWWPALEHATAAYHDLHCKEVL